MVLRFSRKTKLCKLFVLSIHIQGMITIAYNEQNFTY